MSEPPERHSGDDVVGPLHDLIQAFPTGMDIRKDSKINREMEWKLNSHPSDTRFEVPKKGLRMPKGIPKEESSG